MKRRRRPIRKKCYFDLHNIKFIDYKEIELLKNFIAPTAQMLSRRVTGNCAKHQRMLAKAIKRARELALLPFIIR